MIYFGIDPGVTGYLCTLSGTPALGRWTVKFFPCPTMKTGKKGKKQNHPKGMDDLLRAEVCSPFVGCVAGMGQEERNHGSFGIVENITSHAAGGFVNSAFALGGNWWLWRGLLDVREVPYKLMTPQKWLKAAGVPKGSDKDEHIEVAQRLYPDAGVGRNHNKADALLMAHVAGTMR